MWFPCKAQIDFAPGPVAGQLVATVSLSEEGGPVFYTSDPLPVAAGGVITLDPIGAAVTLDSHIGGGPTPPPAPARPGAQPAARAR
jgi:hypothetical protein